MPAPARPNRARRFVSQELQRWLVVRVLFGWAVLLAVGAHLLFALGLFLPGSALAPGDVLAPGGAGRLLGHYGQYLRGLLPAAAVGAALLPLAVRDLFGLTHRVAGPLVRFRHALDAVRRGRPVPPIVLREDDLMWEFAQEFNAFLLSRGGTPGRPGPGSKLRPTPRAATPRPAETAAG